MTRLIIAPAAIALTLIVSACARDSDSKSPAHLVERVALAMGSQLHLTAWTDDEPNAVAAFDAVVAEFARLDALMSVWQKNSDIVRLNLAAGDHPVTVSGEVIEVLRYAREVSELTDGKFDITFGALSDLWRFDHDQDNRVPAAADVARRLPLVDYRAVVIDEGGGRVFLSRPGMRAHLGGIGKGYALDRAAKLLRDRGVVNFMVQAGGDLYVGGHRGDRPWKLGIQDPRGNGGDSFATLELSDRTFSTSGDYERFFVQDGVRYHHIIDPRTGAPAQGSRSVTIVAERAIVADGLSTGVFLLGPERGMALIERLPEVEGVIVTSSNEVLVSSGLRDRLVIRHPPSDFP